MTAIQTVPAGVARILGALAQKACSTRVEVDEGQYWNVPAPPEMVAARAEKFAQEWLDGLARMALVPVEGAL